MYRSGLFFLLVLALTSLACGLVSQPALLTPSPLENQPPSATALPQATATIVFTSTEPPLPTQTDTPVPPTPTVSIAPTETIDPQQATLASEMGSMGELMTNVTQYYHPVGTPLKSWKDIAIMSQATAGQQFKPEVYSYIASATLDQARSFYLGKVSALGITKLPSYGYAGSGSQTNHTVGFFSYRVSIYIVSFDNDTGHVIVILSEVP
jgi:hypothetical protein